MTDRGQCVDLNADLGEGCAGDEALLRIVTSANVACGWHAGDAATMRATIRAALQHGVAIGAHPSYDDREHFGRRAIERSVEGTYADVTAQLETIAGIAASEGAALRHVKPHGALYNTAARSPEVARAIARAVRDFNPSLAIYGLAGSALLDAARHCDLRAVAEGFADRRYAADGSLMPRDRAGAFVHDETEAVDQTLRLIAGGVETVCVHGDDPRALVFATSLRKSLADKAITVRSPRANA